ncbi:unnamed protein product [Agarophyton chilense]
MGTNPQTTPSFVSRFRSWRRGSFNNNVLPLPDFIPYPDRAQAISTPCSPTSPIRNNSNEVSTQPVSKKKNSIFQNNRAQLSLPSRRCGKGLDGKDEDVHKVEEVSKVRDLEAQLPNRSHRFKYNPEGLGQRLLVSARLKSKLETSKIIRIPFSKSYKYTLIFALLFTGAFLTPQMLPKWIGFEWASPEDLCQSPESKIVEIQQQLINFTSLRESKQFLKQQEYTLNCMNRSAADFYHGENGSLPRFLWPHECDSEKARISLNETTCVEQKTNVCKRVNFFARIFASISGDCVQKVGPELCVESTNVERSESLYELEKERNALSQNLTEIDTEPIVSTAESKINEVITRLMTQIDLAADCFIVYSIVAVMVGIPLIISKREKTSRVMSATLGLTKMTFVMVFVILLSLYDSFFLIFQDTDFPRLFQNFLNDPCYVNPTFSSKRVGMIVDMCNNISYIEQQSDYVLQKMDTVYYDTRLFGHCKDDNRELAIHPKLEAMDEIRKLYRGGNISNPGVCNATELDERTSVAPDNERSSKWKALLGSGVVAQLALKIIFTSWIIHLLAFMEPMVLHNGKVELWGMKQKTMLNAEDETAIRRFARDKHLLPLIVFSVLLLAELVLFGYSIYTTINGANELPTQNSTLPLTPAPEWRCPSSLGGM